MVDQPDIPGRQIFSGLLEMYATADLRRRQKADPAMPDIPVAKHLAGSLNITPAAVYNWFSGRTFPQPVNFKSLVRLWFGRYQLYQPEVRELISLYQDFSPYYVSVEEIWGPPFDEEQEYDWELEFAEEIQQRPAAFKFGLRGDKIDALEHVTQVTNEGLAADLLNELIHKTRELTEQLSNSNSASRAVAVSRRLLDCLESSVLDIRPGIVLSRVRGLEALRDAFDTEEGRATLFPDAISMVNGVCLTALDFLTVFPEIREIERQLVALGLERNPDTVARAMIYAKEVSDAAAKSDVVTEKAVAALTENSPDVESAQTIQLKTTLVADKLLVARNFISETARSVATGIVGAWSVVKPDFHDGAKATARVLPLVATVLLLSDLFGPTAGLMALLQGDSFKSLSHSIERLRQSPVINRILDSKTS